MSFQPIGNNNIPHPVFMTNAEVCKYVGPIADLVAPMERGLADFSRTNAKTSDANLLLNPLRQTIDIEKDQFYMTMPVFYRRLGAFACKAIASCKPNPEAFGQEVHSVLTLFDGNNGYPLAVMEADELSGIRTAMISYLSAKHLLADKLPEHIAIFGTGFEASTHIQVIAALLKPKKAFIKGLTLEDAKNFCTRWQPFCSQFGTELVPGDNAKESCKTAEFIVTVTNSVTPVIHSADLSAHCRLICVVGAPVKTYQECEPSILHDATALYVDSRDSALNESGDVVISGREIEAELGNLLNGEKKLLPLGANGKKPYYVFKSQGIAFEDVITAKLAYDNYRQAQSRSA